MKLITTWCPPSISITHTSGNIGSSLVSNDSLLRMYLSRDGGFSWQEIQEGHWSFQLVGLGSIIVMIPKRATVDPVNYVLYVTHHTHSPSHSHTLTLTLTLTLTHTLTLTLTHHTHSHSHTHTSHTLTLTHSHTLTLTHSHTRTHHTHT